ncbi:unnamed protein product [Camellia sinensis]
MVHQRKQHLLYCKSGLLMHGKTNKECLRPTAIQMPLLLRVVNLARVINVLYKDEDGYTHSRTKLKGFVTSVLIDSVPTSTYKE